MTFVDTNVLVYSVDSADARKHQRAAEIVTDMLENPDRYRISSQVLSEFCCTMIRKFGMHTSSLLALVRELRNLKIVDMDADTVARAIELQAIYGIQFYDAQILAAAERAGCTEVYSEDLSSGANYCGMMLVNPFA